LDGINRIEFSNAPIGRPRSAGYDHVIFPIKELLDNRVAETTAAPHDGNAFHC
jgi:hypothetical protein